MGVGPAPALPGADLVDTGVADLRAGRVTVEAMLVARASRRLRDAGVPVPDSAEPDPARRMYDLLAERDPASAYGAYNALTRRLVSYCRAAEHARRR